MDILRRSRRPVRGLLVRRIQELNDELARAQPDRNVIRVKLDLLNRTFEKLQVLDERIIELVNQEDNDEQQDTEFRTVEEYVEQYLTAKAKGERFCDKHGSSEHSRPASPDTSSTVGSTVTGTGHAKTYKLPKIEIRKFNGEFSEWLGF
jgi:DNA gyrase/topoisomerase IV subunit A